MCSCPGVQFVGCYVGCKYLVGDDEGDFDRGPPPLPVWLVCRSRCGEVIVRAVARLVVARAVARMSCVLSMRLFVRWTMDDGGSYVGSVLA